MDPVSACNFLLGRPSHNAFLECLGTGDERWIQYDNAQRNKVRNTKESLLKPTSKEGAAISMVGLHTY